MNHALTLPTADFFVILDADFVPMENFLVDRPPKFDPVDYRDRNVVEDPFNDLRDRLGLATRYDELATVYRAAAVLNPVTRRLHQLRDKPWVASLASGKPVGPSK